MSDILAAMKADAAKMAAEESGAPVTEEQDAPPAEGTDDTASVQGEPSGEAEEGAPKDTDEEQDGKPEDAAEKKAKDDAKEKDSSYKRLQKREEKAREAAKTARKEAAEALVIANKYKRRAEVAIDYAKQLMAQARAAGVRIDQRDGQIFVSRMKEAAREVDEHAPKHFERVEEEAQVAELRQQYVEQAEDLAGKYGLDQGEILRAYAVIVESSSGREDPSMDEVAEMLRDRKRRQQGRPTQAEKNRTAVRPIKSGGIQKPMELGTDTDSMKKWLHSQGLA